MAEDCLLEGKCLIDSWALVWATRRHQAKVQTGRNRGPSGRKQAWAWESCHMSEVGCEGADDAVDASQGDKWWREVVRETGIGRQARRMLELYRARQAFLLGSACRKTCQGLVLNLRNQVDWRENYEGGRGCFQHSAITFQHPVALLADSLHPGVQTLPRPSPELQHAASPTLEQSLDNLPTPNFSSQFFCLPKSGSFFVHILDPHWNEFDNWCEWPILSHSFLPL